MWEEGKKRKKIVLAPEVRTFHSLHRESHVDQRESAPVPLSSSCFLPRFLSLLEGSTCPSHLLLPPPALPQVILGGEASPASDMWSVGCLLSPLLLHRPMFDAKNGKQLMEHIYRVVGRCVRLEVELLRKFVENEEDLRGSREVS